MAKPTTSPFWGDTGGRITDPGSTKQHSGFFAEILPHQWLNWVFNLFGQWLIWLYAYATALDNARPRTWQLIAESLSGGFFNIPASSDGTGGFTIVEPVAGLDVGYTGRAVLATAGIDYFAIRGLTGSWVDYESGTHTYVAVASTMDAVGNWFIAAVTAGGFVRLISRVGASGIGNSSNTIVGAPAISFITYEANTALWWACGAGGVYYAAAAAGTWTQLNATASSRVAYAGPTGTANQFWISISKSDGTISRSVVTAGVPAAATAGVTLTGWTANVKVCEYDVIGAALIITESGTRIAKSADGGATLATAATVLTNVLTVTAMPAYGRVVLYMTDAESTLWRVPTGACDPTKAEASTGEFKDVACVYNKAAAGHFPVWSAKRWMIPDNVSGSGYLIGKPITALPNTTDANLEP